MAGELAKEKILDNSPYKYIEKNMVCYTLEELKNRMTFHDLCCSFRRFDMIEDYDLNYWNELFRYFCSKDEQFEDFESFQQLKDELSLESIQKRLMKKLNKQI